MLTSRGGSSFSTNYQRSILWKCYDASWQIMQLQFWSLFLNFRENGMWYFLVSLGYAREPLVARPVSLLKLITSCFLNCLHITEEAPTQNTCKQLPWPPKTYYSPPPQLRGWNATPVIKGVWVVSDRERIMRTNFHEDAIHKKKRKKWVTPHFSKIALKKGDRGPSVYKRRIPFFWPLF